jgi:hypothetical protein
MGVILDEKTGKHIDEETGEEVDIEKLAINAEKDKKAFKHILG